MTVQEAFAVADEYAKLVVEGDLIASRPTEALIQLARYARAQEEAVALHRAFERSAAAHRETVVAVYTDKTR